MIDRYMDRICKNCRLSFGAHRGDTICKNQCPAHEGMMDWPTHNITVFEDSGRLARYSPMTRQTKMMRCKMGLEVRLANALRDLLESPTEDHKLEAGRVLNEYDGAYRLPNGETWEEHCRRASEPEGLTTGLHRDSMG